MKGPEKGLAAAQGLAGTMATWMAQSWGERACVLTPGFPLPTGRGLVNQLTRPGCPLTWKSRPGSSVLVWKGLGVRREGAEGLWGGRRQVQGPLSCLQPPGSKQLLGPHVVLRPGSVGQALYVLHSAPWRPG